LPYRRWVQLHQFAFESLRYRERLITTAPTGKQPNAWLGHYCWKILTEIFSAVFIRTRNVSDGAPA